MLSAGPDVRRDAAWSRDRLPLLFIAVALLLYSNVPVWVNLFKWPSLTITLWVCFLAIASVWACLQGALAWRSVPAPLPVWVLVVLAMNITWFVAVGGGDPVVLFQRLLMLASMLLAYLVFSASPAALHGFAKALIWVGLATSLANVYDITHPFAFVPRESEFATLGRASGFFANPNQSGAALVLVMMIATPYVAARWRLPFFLILTLGTLLTFSRGAFIGLVLAGLYLGARQVMSWRQVVAASIITVLVAALGVLVVLPIFLDDFGVDLGFVVDRLLWILDPAGRADFSQAERVHLAELGWEQFVRSPWIGNGVGSTELWAERASTHNFFLMQMSDFGILGALVLPSLVAAMIWRRSAARASGYAIGGFAMAWGMISHNVVTEFYWIIAIAWVAALQAHDTTSRGLALGVESR